MQNLQPNSSSLHTQDHYHHHQKQQQQQQQQQHPSQETTSTPQAGTSSTSNRQHHPNPKTLYFPVIDQGHLPAAPISGSHDLLSLFNVSSMYDWFVKPYLKPLDQTNKLGPTNNHPHHHFPNTNGDLKGKGKADIDLAGLSPAQLENLGQKRIKMEKSYGHFVADVGGRNSIKKDHQLETWISDPNFQEASVPNFLKPFSNEALSQAFTLQPGILPGFDSSVWVAEEGGPKKKRKKRKQGEMLAGSNPTPAAAHLQQPHQSPTQQTTMTTTTTTTTTSGTPTQYAVSSTTQAQPTRPLRASMVDPSSHLNSHPHSSHHPAAQTSHLHLHQNQQQQHNSPGMFCREDDYRKKKRVKIGNPAAGKTSGSGSSGPNHQVALQS
ncbi:hypothetical protein PGT21_023577 [Puccinia graminis f. sp. tritici]|uniref:Mediator of RNA polymerase II transcription subunit 19 n=1 Tax=Puccinia graminis f. sp. tritici TaxID=56615 RepID=A0A5B0PA09_PUCGR|nr:hypothetical protein PGT21_023577 [Puccinia graminis f. sp. tritici]KAA1117139.1 hypothetical protein PGTUg99_036217 [Puccinia graminis f. sp. tritici]